MVDCFKPGHLVPSESRQEWEDRQRAWVKLEEEKRVFVMGRIMCEKNYAKRGTALQFPPKAKVYLSGGG